MRNGLRQPSPPGKTSAPPERAAARVLYPLTFHPILKERVWGGNRLQQLFGKALPAGSPTGESWEISDRPGDISRIANGPLAGKDLHWLVEHCGSELLGRARSYDGRFPLLIKILDARDKLSLQVHPPANEAARLGGEPKTEMWYIADAAPEAEVYAGLRRGVTRELFERKLRQGSVADCFHRIKVSAGDAMFLPSGRVHAIGAGLVIFEIQQNSDTTYRVYDWDRLGLDGKPRQLHISESLASIHFDDIEPQLIRHARLEGETPPGYRLVSDPLFRVDLLEPVEGMSWNSPAGALQILGCVAGQLQVQACGEVVVLDPGQFCLLAASLDAVITASTGDSKILRTTV